MKIIIDARTLGSRPSGIGIYLFDFVKALYSNDQFDISLITDIAESEHIYQLKQLGIPIFCYGKKIFKSIGVISYFKFINQILTKEQPNIFWEPNNLIPIQLQDFKGKIVLTIHDLFPITKPDNFSKIYRYYFKQSIKKSIKNADAILFDSEETKRETQDRFPLACQKRCFVSYLIIPKAPPRVIADENYFLYIGNLEHRKGTDLLLEAYEMYLNQNGTLPLYLGGSIREDTIKEQLDILRKKTSKVHYLGYLTEEQKYDFLAKCSCFLFPSRAEGFGIPPLEALGYYKPIIASNLSIFQEILPLPIHTFHLSGTKKEQVQDLCQQMSQNSFESSSPTECQKILEHYNSSLLGEKLSLFFINLMEKQ